MRQKVGVNGFRKHYGTNKRHGTRKNHKALSGGKCIRYCLSQLEAMGFVGTAKFESNDGKSVSMGKSLTPKGVMDLDRLVSTHNKKQQK